jgi:hypothetical protein
MKNINEKQYGSLFYDGYTAVNKDGVITVNIVGERKCIPATETNDTMLLVKPDRNSGNISLGFNRDYIITPTRNFQLETLMGWAATTEDATFGLVNKHNNKFIGFIKKYTQYKVTLQCGDNVIYQDINVPYRYGNYFKIEKIGDEYSWFVNNELVYRFNDMILTENLEFQASSVNQPEAELYFAYLWYEQDRIR